MQNEVIARLDGVTRQYGDIRALDEVSLRIRRGELVALLGPNGAGKTSAVRLLLGLSSPTSGRVSVFGGDPREERFRARTGAMLQSAQLPDALRVREHIQLFSSYYPNPMPTSEVLRIAGLETLAPRLFGRLSGGERQRVLFALSICGNPDLLILDEPTVGLDVDSRRRLWREIERLRAGGRTILLTTHYLNEADELADRVVVIDHGKLIADGTPAEIRLHCAGRKIRFRSSAPPDRVRKLASGSTVEWSSGRFEIVARQPEAIVRELLAALPDITELEVSGAGLEEAFLALTSGEEQERVA